MIFIKVALYCALSPDSVCKNLWIKKIMLLFISNKIINRNLTPAFSLMFIHLHHEIKSANTNRAMTKPDLCL
ncbi:MAG TPA: hypothetical protein DCL86_05910 [Bacteroidales bacterium]|nr:hypothetical protein [Bacteroidales bacterium]